MVLSKYIHPINFNIRTELKNKLSFLFFESIKYKLPLFLFQKLNSNRENLENSKYKHKL